MVQSVNDPTIKQPVAGAPTDDDATIVVGETRPMPSVLGYDITGHIGEGGMADVWLGVDLNLKRQAAVKTMSAELITDPEFIQRFAEEAQIVAGFRHDNIVTVFSSGQSLEHHWIAMEFVSGGTLGDRLKVQRPLPPEEALSIAQSMADALAYSHDHGIIHRDFKPGNVLFTGEGTPVLSDFGIAKSSEIEEGGGLTVPGLVIGSPRYMAPEQMLGKHVTGKVDVYALGLVLFEMLVGDVPPPDIAMIKGPKQIHELGNMLPAGPRKKAILNILTDCLREDPAERADASSIAARLKELTQPTVARSKTAGILTVAAFVVLLGAFITTQVLQTKIELDVSVQPAAAYLFVDGQLIDGVAMIEPGPHQVVAVEPNHYGQVVLLDESDDMALEITLEEMRLPTFDEFGAYQRLDDVPLAELVPQAVGYEPFERLLQMREHGLRGETAELEQMVAELNALAAAGDPAAQVILFVANIDNVIEGDRFSGLIQQASNSGYGLATFFQALHYQWAKTGEDGTMDRSSIQVYRSLMALAQDQGLTFADMYVQSADDLLTGT